VSARRTLLVAACAAAPLAGCSTVRPSIRDGTTPTYSLFLDRNYAFLNHPDDGAMYEAQVAPNFALSQSTDRAFGRVYAERRWHKATALTVTPLVRLRQLGDSSSPVRSPSFMPKLTAQWLWARRDRRAFFDSATQSFSPVQLVGIQAIAGHHSNGQAGCFYANRERDPRDFDRCILRPGADPDSRSLNEVDGDFSTHYLRVGGDWRRVHVDATARERLAYGASASAEQHVPAGVVGGGLSDEQRTLYGSRRLAASGEVVWRDSAALAALPGWIRPLRALGGAARLTAYGERALGVGDGVPASRWSVEAAHTFDRAFGLGLFVRRHQGQNYLNIAFTRRLDAWQFGATIDLERRAHFRRPARAGLP
jgi:hypothetical protein